MAKKKWNNWAIWQWLLVIGGINWLLVLLDFNLVTTIAGAIGTWFTTIAYLAVGFSGFLGFLKLIKVFR